MYTVIQENETPSQTAKNLSEVYANLSFLENKAESTIRKNIIEILKVYTDPDLYVEELENGRQEETKQEQR